MDRIRILLVDDHALVRQGIASLLSTQPDLEVVGEAGDGMQAVTAVRFLQPDVVLMDVQMPGMDGLAATTAVLQVAPDCRVLILTASEDNQHVYRAVRAGACGYLLKNLPAPELFAAVRDSYRGVPPVSSVLAGQILTDLGVQAEPAAAALSPRETEVLKLVGRGLHNRQIGQALFISENTVKIHLRNILAKLHLANRIQAATYAQREGLVGKDRA